LKTGNFKTYTGDNGIAICLYPPLDWSGPRFAALEPDRKTFFAKKAEQIDEAEYERRYRVETLSLLDPKEIYDRLQNYVLLCWEPAGQFCHRRIIADWIQKSLDIEVPEWNPSDEIKKKDESVPLF
jgi:uncharacterized protein (DUF488 family)